MKSIIIVAKKLQSPVVWHQAQWGVIAIVEAIKEEKEYKNTSIEYGGQTLQFALTFPAISAEDKSVNLVVPSSTWKFKDLTIY